MSESKHYFQLIHENEDGTKTYRINGIRRCEIGRASCRERV